MYEAALPGSAGARNLLFNVSRYESILENPVETESVVVHKKQHLQTSILMFSSQTLSVSSSSALSLSQLGRIRITGMNEVIDGNIIIDPGIISYYSYIDMSTHHPGLGDEANTASRPLASLCPGLAHLYSYIQIGLGHK